jgi:hypothetical protein
LLRGNIGILAYIGCQITTNDLFLAKTGRAQVLFVRETEEVMSVRMILLPVFVQVALTFVLLFWASRGSGARADGQLVWQEELQLPILFYVLTIIAWQTQFAELLFLLLAWVFVALRVLRALRQERNAGALFAASAIVLAVMWLIYAIRLLLAM